MKIIFLEGARGTGKSTVAQLMRSRLPATTLINATGFKEDGDKGFLKIVQYYVAMFKMLESSQSLTDATFIFDRFFFTETVFSQLYKTYGNDFSIMHNNFMYQISQLRAEVHIVYMRCHSSEELEQRLVRNKLPFASVEESVWESQCQDQRYELIFNKLIEDKKSGLFKNIDIHEVKVDGKDPEIVFEEVKSLTAN